ncbi:MAG: hypothetical protein K1Y02_19320, partial [Candidatus Hydrogenedentes bacterium]|nr:hypothetical protein [Candidatus Hydrogenedentota bacterium]
TRPTAGHTGLQCPKIPRMTRLSNGRPLWKGTMGPTNTRNLAHILILCLAVLTIQAVAQDFPAIKAKAELISAEVHPGAIHGWHSNRLVMVAGTLYACATLPNPDGESPDQPHKNPGAVFRREPDGKWSTVGTTSFPPYILMADSQQRMWILGASAWDTLHVLRTRLPRDFATLEEVHQAKNAYFGASISPEDNVLVLWATQQEQAAGKANSLTADFYDAAQDKWYKSTIATPEGRYGYEGILLNKETALAVINSSLYDPEHADSAGGKYSWRHARLVASDDLHKKRWRNKPWLMPADGRTVLQDLILGNDGNAYLSYAHVSAPSHIELLAALHTPHYVARIGHDLQVTEFETGLRASATRLLVDASGEWYLLGRPESGGALHLWALDAANGFVPVREFVIEGSDVLEAYVVHSLRPERFGGESDGETIHLLSTRPARDAEGKDLGRAELWHVSFNLAEAKAKQ